VSDPRVLDIWETPGGERLRIIEDGPSVRLQQADERLGARLTDWIDVAPRNNAYNLLARLASLRPAEGPSSV